MAKQKEPRSAFVWLVLCFGLAGIFHRQVPGEFWPEDDWLGLGLVNTMLIAMTFVPTMVSARPSRPLLRWGITGAWSGRALLAVSVVYLVLTRKSFASAFVVLVSSYLVAWALFGADKLLRRGSWRLLGPRTSMQGALAQLSSEPVPIRQPSIALEDWLKAIAKICRRIDYWEDASALRTEVFEKLESQECLHHYRLSMDEPMWQATMHFVRSIGTRNVKGAAKAMLQAYRRCDP